MHYVLLSVVCSVSVSIVIKLARNKNVNHLQLLVWNYPVTVLLAYILLEPQVDTNQWVFIPWTLFALLAFLMPLIFIFIALSIQHGGIVKTEVAQRLSLFIPLLAAFFIFREEMGNIKLIGIALGLIAMIFSVGWQKQSSNNGMHKSWVYLTVVFTGMGIIDVLFKKVSQLQTVSYMTALFLIFILAMLFAFVYLLYLLTIRKQKLDIKSLIWGGGVGFFNFGNILFYMKAHRALPENPSIVFTAMNIGVIVMGTVVGVCFFNEKLSIYNRIGLLLAVISVLVITYA